MPDPAPFLAAICANPDDDLPRLVYADWLDEHGDPARAEFIRLQCHTARVGKLDPTWAPAKLREYDLFKANEATWRTPTASDEGRMLMDRWVRGFPRAVMLADVSSGRLTSGEWANGVYDWYAHPHSRYDPWPGGPVREVTFSGWDDECGDLLWQPQLRTVRSLSLGEWYAGVGTRRVESFITALSLLPPGHFPELTALDFGGELTLNALETLAESAVVESLTGLSLRFPDDVSAGEAQDWSAATARLFERVATRLESLELHGLPPALLPAFAAVRWPRLRRLHVRDWSNRPFEGYTRAVLPTLNRLVVSHIGRLALRQAWHSAESIVALARWPALRTVTAVALGQVPAGFMQQFLRNVGGSSFDFLAAHVEPDTPTPLRVGDIATHQCFRDLKGMAGSFTNADLASLADPTVLPELHTIWSNAPYSLPTLRWRGGVRTVIPKDPPEAWRHRPSRGSWCGGQ